MRYFQKPLSLPWVVGYQICLLWRGEEGSRGQQHQTGVCKSSRPAALGNPSLLAHWPAMYVRVGLFSKVQAVIESYHRKEIYKSDNLKLWHCGCVRTTIITFLIWCTGDKLVERGTYWNFVEERTLALLERGFLLQQPQISSEILILLRISSFLCSFILFSHFI